MTDAAKPGPIRTARRETLLLGGGIAAAVAVAVALPLWLDGRGLEDPAADAEATYRELLLRIEARQSNPGPEGSASVASVASTNRDLFSPVAKRRPDLAAVQARRKRPKLPTLTSVLIDGPSRQAVLDGRIVAIGERVGDYRVDAIENGTVTLHRNGSTHRLTMGGER